MRGFMGFFVSPQMVVLAEALYSGNPYPDYMLISVNMTGCSFQDGIGPFGAILLTNS